VKLNSTAHIIEMQVLFHANLNRSHILLPKVLLWSAIGMIMSSIYLSVCDDMNSD